MALEALLSDFDGVIGNSEGDSDESGKKWAWKEGFAKYGIPGGGAWYAALIGHKRVELCEMAIKEFDLSVSLDVFEVEIGDLEKAAYEKGIPPIPETIDLIKRAAAAGIPIGVVSSQRRKLISLQLVGYGIGDLIEILVSADDDKLPGKPDPAPYLRGAVDLGFNPANCLTLEDTGPGVESAKRAGMRCIGFVNPDSGIQDLSKADVVLDAAGISRLSISDLRSLVP
jgi:HAD superfamily hydrolase (TIGR01509 family)